MAALVALLLTDSVRSAEPAQPILVYAAVSLTNVLDEVARAYLRETGRPVKLSYASSAILARQIEAGAEPDVFFSADTEWMDYLQKRNLIAPGTRVDLLTNRLVLIAPTDNAARIVIAPNFGLVDALDGRRLSMADPDSVPAGKYARAALVTLGVWDQVADRIVRADNVRAALAFVARGDAPLGIVYATDARLEKGVRVVDEFPEGSHPPIVYPVAATAHSRENARSYLEYLQGKSAIATFERYGFGIVTRRSER